MIRPLGDRCVIELSKKADRSAGGVFLPDTNEKQTTGLVVAVGPGRFEDGRHIRMAVRVGDRVVFSKYGGTEVTVDGAEYLVIRESDILGVE